MLLYCETDLDAITNAILKTKPEFAVIDSIQTMYSEEVGSAPGSVSQVREATNTLMQLVHKQAQTAPLDEGHQHVDAVGRNDFLFKLGKHLRLVNGPGEKRALCDGGLRALYIRRCFPHR